MRPICASLNGRYSKVPAFAASKPGPASTRRRRWRAAAWKICTADDDPEGAAFVARAKANEVRAQSFIDTLSSTVDMTQASDQALGDAGNTLQQIYDLAVQLGTDTVAGAERLTAVVQVDNLRGLLVENLNRKFDDRTLFAGSREDGLAFDPTSVPPEPSSATPTCVLWRPHQASRRLCSSASTKPSTT